MHFLWYISTLNTEQSRPLEKRFIVFSWSSKSFPLSSYVSLLSTELTHYSQKYLSHQRSIYFIIHPLLTRIFLRSWSWSSRIYFIRFLTQYYKKDCKKRLTLTFLRPSCSKLLRQKLTIYSFQARRMKNNFFFCQYVSLVCHPCLYIKQHSELQYIRLISSFNYRSIISTTYVYASDFFFWECF